MFFYKCDLPLHRVVVEGSLESFGRLYMVRFMEMECR